MISVINGKSRRTPAVCLMNIIQAYSRILQSADLVLVGLSVSVLNKVGPVKDIKIILI